MKQNTEYPIVYINGRTFIKDENGYTPIALGGMGGGRKTIIQGGGNPSVNGETKTFLVPLDYTMFNVPPFEDVPQQKLLAVGRLPLGYRYWGFIFKNESLWNDVANSETSINLVILDTVSGKEIDIPVFGSLALPLSLTSLLPSQQVDGSVSIGAIDGFTGNCFLDGDGLQGISIRIFSSTIPLSTLDKGTASLYIIATKIPTSPDSLLAP